jgi:hypothetical protein
MDLNATTNILKPHTGSRKMVEMAMIANAALLSPGLAFKDMLFEENIDLNWLNCYTTLDGARVETATADEPGPRQYLELQYEQLCSKFRVPTHQWV